MKFQLDSGSSIFMGVWFTSSGKFRVGRDSVINPGCHIDTRGGVSIGDNVSVAQNSSLVTGDHDPNDPKFLARFRPIIIEDHAFIGYGATVLGGVTIRKGAIVAAGSIATKDVEEFSIVGGIPAKMIGQRTKRLEREGGYSRLFG